MVNTQETRQAHEDMDVFTVEGGFAEVSEQKLQEGMIVENWDCQEYKR